MTRRITILLLLAAGLAGTAHAFLPPDASAREPQIRAYRQQVREKYQERQIERQAQAIRVYQQTRADIFTPPWMRGKAQATLAAEGTVAASGSGKENKRNHRFLISVVLLILLGAGAGWIRHATREIDQ